MRFRKASVWVIHQACKEPVSGYCCCSSWVILQALMTKAFLLCSVHPFTRCIGPFKASFCLLKPRSCWTDLLDDWLIFPFAGYKCDHKCESMDWCEWNGTDSVLVLSLSLSLSHMCISLYSSCFSLALPQVSDRVRLKWCAQQFAAFWKNVRNAPAFPVSSVRIRHTNTQLHIRTTRLIYHISLPIVLHVYKYNWHYCYLKTYIWWGNAQMWYSSPDSNMCN